MSSARSRGCLLYRSSGATCAYACPVPSPVPLSSPRRWRWYAHLHHVCGHACVYGHALISPPVKRRWYTHLHVLKGSTACMHASALISPRRCGWLRSQTQEGCGHVQVRVHAVYAVCMPCVYMHVCILEARAHKKGCGRCRMCVHMHARACA